MYLSAPVASEEPPGPVTRTSTVPAAAGGAIAVTRVGDSTVKLDAGDTTAACHDVTSELSAAVNGDPVLTDQYTQMNTLCSARASVAEGAIATDSASGAPASSQAGKPRADTTAKPKGVKPDSVSP